MVQLAPILCPWNTTEFLAPWLAPFLRMPYNDIMKRPVILVASPLARLRRRWHQALKLEFTIRHAGNPAALEQSMANLKPAILLLDLALLGNGEVAGVRSIQRLSRLTKIVLFTRTPHGREGVSALKAGASGYCNTDMKPFLLKKAIEIIQIGEIWLGRDLIAYLTEKALPEPEQKDSPIELNSLLERLTPREREIAGFIARGDSNKEIAIQVNVTQRTIKAHVTAIFQKLGLSNRIQLALFIREHNRLSP